ncbi:hypothetical protein Y1Q_0013188 [Alligator mississippiensis]|uniref:Ubiquitin-like domain-containing protein n=1 Tax=Alligator mississippiensis TaxID=8496 RepID=A0A151NUB5_ALLMI|nr:hypothetical protein Y1Q_0013188 [Alligator mississippiensis]
MLQTDFTLVYASSQLEKGKMFSDYHIRNKCTRVMITQLPREEDKMPSSMKETCNFHTYSMTCIQNWTVDSSWTGRVYLRGNQIDFEHEGPSTSVVRMIFFPGL